MGLGHISLAFFFEWFPSWDSQINDIDLSTAEDLLKGCKVKIIQKLLSEDGKLMKLTLSNSSLDGE